MARSSEEMRGTQVLITGASNGIGLAAATALAGFGANIAIVGRNEARTKSAAAQIQARARKDARISAFIADFASQAAVAKFAMEVLSRHPKIDILVNNAGAMHTTRQLTDDGIELTWAVNHLAPFLLTGLIVHRLEAHVPSRIITTASDAHYGAAIPFGDLDAEKGYHGFARYKQTKLANILFTRELARRLEDRGTVCSCFHPGLVASGFNRNNGPLMNLAMTLLWPVSRSVEKGAETLVWLARTSDVGGMNGGYFVDMERRQPSPQAQEAETARRLWDISERQCARHWPS